MLLARAPCFTAPQEEAQNIIDIQLSRCEVVSCRQHEYTIPNKKQSQSFFANLVQKEYLKHIEHSGVKCWRESVSGI